MTSTLYEAEKRCHVVRPTVQLIGDILLPLKCNESRWSIDLGVDCLISDELRKRQFRSVLRQIQKMRKASQSDLGVIFGNDTDILRGRENRLGYNVYDSHVQQRACAVLPSDSCPLRFGQMWM